MDSFIEFLFTIALVALFSLPSLLKKKTVKNIDPNVMPEEDFETEDIQEEMSDVDTVETWHRPEEEREYFTYERMPDASVAEEREREKKLKQTAQVIEDKSNEGSLLDFSEEEMLKGVIYSEILKRKF